MGVFIQLLSVGNLNPPDIHYSYTVQHTSLARYTWQLSNLWSACDKVCNGKSFYLLHKLVPYTFNHLGYLQIFVAVKLIQTHEILLFFLGEMRRILVCIKLEDRQEVSLDLCNGIEKPDPPRQACNNHCVLRYDFIYCIYLDYQLFIFSKSKSL